jgi:Family of unknown function (DUF5675)
MKLELIRTYFPDGTNGALFLNGKMVCSTIELPQKNNQPRISCIPEGQYALIKRYNPKFKWHFQLLNVPGRNYILIHPANDAVSQLKGCIAPVSLLTGPGKGLRSVMAFQLVKQHLFPLLQKNQQLFLTIKS